MKKNTISNLITSIRNANIVEQKILKVPFTKISYNILQILKKEGYINNFKKIEEGLHFYLIIHLKKNSNKVPNFSKIKQISKPGLRVYSQSKKLPTILGNLGTAIISTSHGLMTNTTAKSKGIGGEILFYIW